MSDPIFGVLPSELMEAPNQLIAWSREALLREQAASTPTEPLYHYTGEDGLRGILKSETFRCFSHLQQSDPAEFEFALGVAMEVLQRQSLSKDFIKRTFAECVIDMLRKNKLSGPFEFYLVSFSRHRDHGPQWAAYGRAGTGYAIGLSPALFQPDKDDLYAEANKNLHVGRVVYGEREARDRHARSVEAAAEIARRVGNDYRALLRDGGPAVYLTYLQTMAHELLASQMIWNCLTAKEQKFADEREVRGIIMNVRAKFDPWRRSVGARNYVEHVLPLKEPGSITEILVGPAAAPDSKDRVRALLKAEGYPDTIPVRRGA
jgi:hypothetical protein